MTKLNVRQIQTDQEKFVSTEEVPSHLEMTVDTGIKIQKNDQLSGIFYECPIKLESIIES